MKTPPSNFGADELARELEALLSGFRGRYEQLAANAATQREAIRQADGARVQACAAGQEMITAELGKLDQRRRELVALASRLPALAGKPSVSITLTNLASCLPEPHRSALTAAAKELKKLIASVQEQTGTLKAATTSLVAHMEGLMRQVARQLSHAGTYTRRGYVEAGGVVVSALDLST